MLNVLLCCVNLQQQNLQELSQSSPYWEGVTAQLFSPHLEVFIRMLEYLKLPTGAELQ